MLKIDNNQECFVQLWLLLERTRQMLKNWRKQGLVVLTEDGSYRKVS